MRMLYWQIFTMQNVCNNMLHKIIAMHVQETQCKSLQSGSLTITFPTHVSALMQVVQDTQWKSLQSGSVNFDQCELHVTCHNKITAEHSYSWCAGHTMYITTQWPTHCDTLRYLMYASHLLNVILGHIDHRAMVWIDHHFPLLSSWQPTIPDKLLPPATADRIDHKQMTHTLFNPLHTHIEILIMCFTSAQVILATHITWWPHRPQINDIIFV